MRRVVVLALLALALPMAAWAGSVDLVPGPGPWVAFWVGALLFVVWIVLLVRLGRIPVTTRHRRYDVRAMSRSEDCTTPTRSASRRR